LTQGTRCEVKPAIIYPFFQNVSFLEFQITLISNDLQHFADAMVSDDGTVQGMMRFIRVESAAFPNNFACPIGG
jgi:hypothetical protein